MAVITKSHSCSYNEKKRKEKSSIFSQKSKFAQQSVVCKGSIVSYTMLVQNAVEREYECKQPKWGNNGTLGIPYTLPSFPTLVCSVFLRTVAKYTYSSMLLPYTMYNACKQPFMTRNILLINNKNAVIYWPATSRSKRNKFLVLNVNSQT